MVCCCWVDDSEIEPELIDIRNHAKEIIRLAKMAQGKENLSPNNTPLHRIVMEDIHALLDDLWNGKCQETGKEIKF
jgi:hypothetical protein